MNGIINQYKNMLQKKPAQKFVLLVSVTIIWRQPYHIAYILLPLFESGMKTGL